jgi:hypothetical protein
MAIKVSGITVIDDDRNLTNISSGAVVGIQSAGVSIGIGATTLNFIGVGNTFAYNPSTKTLDISISGGGGDAIITVPTRSGIAVTFSLAQADILTIVARSGNINVPI